MFLKFNPLSLWPAIILDLDFLLLSQLRFLPRVYSNWSTVFSFIKWMLRETISGETKIEIPVREHSCPALTSHLCRGQIISEQGRPQNEALSILISGPPKKDPNPRMNLLSAWPKATALISVPFFTVQSRYSTVKNRELVYTSGILIHNL